VTVLRAVFVLALAAVAVTACNGDDEPTDEEIQMALQAMVLQEPDIPEGLEPLGGSFADNAQAASGLGSGPTKEQLDALGRILGYRVEYQAGEPPPTTAVIRVQSDATLYENADGATQSFNDRVTLARNADWRTSHSSLAEFMQEEIERDLGADESYWLHLTGYQITSSGERRLTADDNIVFRIGESTGFINVVGLAAVGEDNREFMSAEAETLARRQIEHMRDGLDSLD
jgi:hypothetical protein